jgi:hypothetical protein
MEGDFTLSFVFSGTNKLMFPNELNTSYSFNFTLDKVISKEGQA